MFVFNDIYCYTSYFINVIYFKNCINEIYTFLTINEVLTLTENHYYNFSMVIV